MDQHLPPVLGCPRAQDKAALYHPVHEFDCTVMLDLQPLGQNADARLALTSHRQQQLVLLGLESCCARRLFAEVQKPANLVANLR